VSKNKNNINDNKPIFKLRLPPDLVKDLRKSSDDILNLSSSTSSQSTRFNSIRDLIRQPTMEILSSDDEYLVYDNHSLSNHSEVEHSDSKSLSSTRTSSPSPMENNRNPLLEEDSSLVNLKNLSQGNNLSTPKGHKFYSMKQKSMNIQPQKDSNDDPFGFMATDDPFGFMKAEELVRSKRDD